MGAAPGPAPAARRGPGRYPAVARACFHLNWVLAGFWLVYVLGPDVLGLLGFTRGGRLYAVFTGAFFLLHFATIATGIIALFVVIIEVHAGRKVHGFRAVLLSLALPIASFLYFAGRFLAQVERFLAA